MALTVKQLIRELQTLPQDAKVVFPVPTHDILNSEVLSEARDVRLSWAVLAERDPREHEEYELLIREGHDFSDLDEVVVIAAD